MPVTPEDYNNDAIKGEKLERLANLVIQKLVDNGMVSAESLVELERRLSSVEQHLADTNIGDREADSLDAQSLKVGGNDVAETLSGKADKASSGNGMLAVIDANGNFASSGITAYNQSQLNGILEGKVMPSLYKRSQIDEQLFRLNASATDLQNVFFVDEYTGENRLKIGIYFDDQDDYLLRFRLQFDNEDWNSWIWEGQTTAASAPVGGVEMYCGYIKNTNGNVVSNAIRSEHVLDAWTHTGTPAIINPMFAAISIGSANHNYDSVSKMNVIMNIFNSSTGKSVYVSFDLGITCYASGQPLKAEIIGSARCISYGFNS